MCLDQENSIQLSLIKQREIHGGVWVQNTHTLQDTVWNIMPAVRLSPLHSVWFFKTHFYSTQILLVILDFRFFYYFFYFLFFFNWMYLIILQRPAEQVSLAFCNRDEAHVWQPDNHETTFIVPVSNVHWLFHLPLSWPQFLTSKSGKTPNPQHDYWQALCEILKRTRKHNEVIPLPPAVSYAV